MYVHDRDPTEHQRRAIEEILQPRNALFRNMFLERSWLKITDIDEHNPSPLVSKVRKEYEEYLAQSKGGPTDITTKSDNSMFNNNDDNNKLPDRHFLYTETAKKWPPQIAEKLQFPNAVRTLTQLVVPTLESRQFGKRIKNFLLEAESEYSKSFNATSSEPEQEFILRCKEHRKEFKEFGTEFGDVLADLLNICLKEGAAKRPDAVFYGTPESYGNRLLLHTSKVLFTPYDIFDVKKDLQLCTLNCKPGLVIFKHGLDLLGDWKYMDIYDIERARMSLLTSKIVALGTEHNFPEHLSEPAQICGEMIAMMKWNHFRDNLWSKQNRQDYEARLLRIDGVFASLYLCRWQLAEWTRFLDSDGNDVGAVPVWEEYPGKLDGNSKSGFNLLKHEERLAFLKMMVGLRCAVVDVTDQFALTAPLHTIYGSGSLR